MKNLPTVSGIKHYYKRTCGRLANEEPGIDLICIETYPSQDTYILWSWFCIEPKPSVSSFTVFVATYWSKVDSMIGLGRWSPGEADPKPIRVDGEEFREWCSQYCAEPLTKLSKAKWDFLVGYYQRAQA